ncbi:uncharacterized protein LOC134818191 isoform X2 [Bolinopsis microptera]|uniref:uncharacterized protein LOC134818191 isoform X2 n=1 Tax=Bolinopsis microptera TaxID=2820187 RepID=UPI003079219A
MNLFAVLLFACFGQTVRSYQCVAGIKSYFEKLDVSGGVFTEEDVELDCGKNKLIKIWTEPVKPTRRHGTEFHGIGRDTNEASLKIMTVRRLWFRCENSKRREESAKFLYGQKTLPEVKKVCPKKMKALITALDPMSYEYDRYDDTPDFNQDACIGKTKCVIKKGTRIATATYKIETDCRAENHALHCCNSEESKDSEMFKAKRACNLILECECCQRQTDDKVNIRSCGSMGKKWANAGFASLAGINHNMGIKYDESDDDDATDGDPDFDEDGCHVRKAYLKVGDGNPKPICIPGNMARILSLVDLFSDQHGGKCVVRSIKNDDACTGEVDPAEQYYFGVNVLLPPESGVASNLKNALTARLEEENIETPFLLKDNIKERTNLNDVDMIKFTLAFSL